MIVPDGYNDVPAGKIAAVVTALEMRAPAPRRPEPAGHDWELRRADKPDLDWYRSLFRRVGEDWLWFSRLRMLDKELIAAIHHPQVEVHALWTDGQAEGLLELDFRKAGECELDFFGVTAPLIGSGAGRWLMNRAIELAWSHPIERFWVHTCTLDHHSALPFYMRSGFTAYRRQIEIADDPRLTGDASPTAARHVPIVADNRQKRGTGPSEA